MATIEVEGKDNKFVRDVARLAQQHVKSKGNDVQMTIALLSGVVGQLVGSCDEKFEVELLDTSMHNVNIGIAHTRKHKTGGRIG